MPAPKKGESKDDYISRFMSDDVMKSEYPDEKQRMAVATSKWEDNQKNMSDDKTYVLDNVEIFESGKWNGDNYTEKDLDDIVIAFNDTRDALKPYLKLGHSNNQTLLQRDGFPAAGWVTSLKRKGKKLIAKLENVPEKIYSLIQNKAYGRISSEIFWNLNLNGKKYKRALKAIALLGADTPEVHSLNDFINLYTENFDAEIKYYHILQEPVMDEKIIELQSQVSELSGKIEALSKENDSLKTENNELKDYAMNIEHEKKVSEITSYLDKKVEYGIITPSQVDYFTAIALGDEVKTYTNGSNQKIEGNSFDMVKNILENASPVVDMGARTKDSQPESKVYSKKPAHDEDELDKKIKQYAKENKVSYAEAFEAIAYEGGE